MCSELRREAETPFSSLGGVTGGKTSVDESEQTNLCLWWGSAYAVSLSVWTPCCVLVRYGSRVHFRRWCHTLGLRAARRHPPEGEGGEKSEIAACCMTYSKGLGGWKSLQDTKSNSALWLNFDLDEINCTNFNQFNLQMFGRYIEPDDSS